MPAIFSRYKQLSGCHDIAIIRTIEREGEGGEEEEEEEEGGKKKNKKDGSNGTIRAALKRDFWPKRPSDVSTTFHRIPHCLDRSVIHVGINKNSRNDDRLRTINDENYFETVPRNRVQTKRNVNEYRWKNFKIDKILSN